MTHSLSWTNVLICFGLWTVLASGYPASFSPAVSSFTVIIFFQKAGLVLLWLVSGASSQLCAWGRSSLCGGHSGMCWMLVQRLLVLRQLIYWWNVSLWEVWGRREIKPGRSTGDTWSGEIKECIISLSDEAFFFKKTCNAVSVCVSVN